ncbi:MAG: esterase family protein [Clostridium sp.]|nr:esterase family protein [Clostridium sp.]
MSQCEINLFSKILCSPVDISVILPGPDLKMDPEEFYESEKKYKVLWLLHGGNNDRYCYLNETKLKSYVKGRDVVVVMPNGLNSDFANHPEFADKYNYSDFFMGELMPFIHNCFPVSKAPKDNFLAGFSMGAAAAWMYGLSHPDKFGAISPMGSSLKDYSELEKYRDMKSDSFREAAAENKKLFVTGYGPAESGIKIKEINMIAKYPTVGAFLDSEEHTRYLFQKAVESDSIPKTYLPCGTKGGMYGKVLALQKDVQQRRLENITFEFFEDYADDYIFVDMVLPQVLSFFGI